MSEEVVRVERMGTATDREIGALVEQRRKELGWSQERLAVEAGVSDTTIRKIERGSGTVQAGKLVKVRERLGIPAASTTQHFDRDVELVQQMVGLWLQAVPPEQRAARVLVMTQFLYQQGTAPVHGTEETLGGPSAG